MFQNIPVNIRVPLFYAEMDNSMAGTFQQNYRALLIGQSTKSSGVVDEPKLISSRGGLIELVGADSMLVGMYDMFRKNNIATELWALPVAENTSGVKATGTITITGTATENGVLSLYIAGKLVSTTILDEDIDEEIAIAVASAINNNTSLPITAVADDGVITLTCKLKGLMGNDIDLRFNYLGENNGEIIPAGIELNIVAMSGGLLNPVIDTALASLGDETFDFIGLPFTDSANLTSMQEFMNDTTGRWSWEKQVYGHSFSVINKDTAEAQTFGSNLNDQHKTIANLYKTPNPTYEVLGALLGQASSSLGIDPARPLQTLPLIGILAPDVKDLLDTTNRNTLLFNGIATIGVVNGTCQIERLVTTYQKDKCVLMLLLLEQ
jgi:phage tail sheath gpL-like